MHRPVDTLRRPCSKAQTKPPHGFNAQKKGARATRPHDKLFASANSKSSFVRYNKVAEHSCCEISRNCTGVAFDFLLHQFDARLSRLSNDVINDFAFKSHGSQIP